MTSMCSFFKKIRLTDSLITIFIFGWYNCSIAQSTTIYFTTPGSTTWTVPPCVYRITVQVWGGGGGGGSVWSRWTASCTSTDCQSAEICNGGGGGGGGGYSTRTYSVEPGQVYQIVVGSGGLGGVINTSGDNRANAGSSGGNSTFSGPATLAPGTLTATGGAGGGAGNLSRGCLGGCYGHDGRNGNGGSAGVGQYGTTNLSGGAGRTGEHSNSIRDRSGGGGGGAGTTASGSNGFLPVDANDAIGGGGAGGLDYGGNGGNGRTGSYWSGYGGHNGGAATTIGGGGGGAVQHNRIGMNRSSATNHVSQTGGNGARGEVRITYTTSPAPSVGSGFVNGEWAFHGTVDGAGNVTNVDWEQGVNWRVWDQTQAQFILPASYPTTTSDVRLKSGTCLAQPTINSITDNSNGIGAANCRDIVIENTGTLTINSDADVEHFHILGNYSNSGTVNYNNGRFKFVKSGTQTIYDASGTATFWEMNIGGNSLTDLNSAVTILNALRINGVVKTDGYLYWLNTTSTDGASTGVVDNAYGGHVFGTFRRTIQNNTATYRFPVGVNATITTGRRLLEFINNGVSGVSYLDCSVSATYKGQGNNMDQYLNSAYANQNGQVINLMHEEAEWTLIPSASPASGSYGVNLFAQNILSLDGIDNRFVVLKRPDASTSFADFNTFQNTTVIPQNGQPGRVYNSGSGYAQRTGFTAFSRFAIGSVPLALGVELGEFDLHCNDEYVELSFSTLIESNTSHFSIRTSSDGLHFTDTYLIQAAENSAEETFYTAMLNEPRAHYLQLEQYDRDGSHELLKTAYLPDCSSDRSSVSPSPDGLYIQVYLAGDTSSDVMVFNTDGRLLHSGRTKGKENEVYFIDRTLFDNAVYLIRIVNEESEEILRFVNQ